MVLSLFALQILQAMISAHTQAQAQAINIFLPSSLTNHHQKCCECATFFMVINQPIRISSPKKTISSYLNQRANILHKLTWVFLFLFHFHYRLENCEKKAYFLFLILNFFQSKFVFSLSLVSSLVKHFLVQFFQPPISLSSKPVHICLFSLFIFFLFISSIYNFLFYFI